MPPAASITPVVANDAVKPALPDVAQVSSAQKNASQWSDKNVECRVCNVFCSTQDQLDIHYTGHKHKKRALIYADFMKASQSFDRHTISKTGSSNWYCVHCRAPMDSMNSVLQHLESVKHRRYFGPSNVSTFKRSDNADKDKNRVDATSVLPAPKPAQVADASIVSPFAQPPPVAVQPSNQADKVATAPPMTSPSSVQNDVLKGLKALSANKPCFPGPTPVISKARPGEVNPMDVAAAKIAGTTAVAHGAASLSCSACNVTCNSTESLVMHLASNRHKRRMAALSGSTSKPNAIVLPQAAVCHAQKPPVEFGAPPSGVTQPANTTPTRPDVDMYCEVCCVPICGRRNYEDHIRGRLHCKNLNLKKAVDAPKPPAPNVESQQERPTSSLSSATKGVTNRNDSGRNAGCDQSKSQSGEENSGKVKPRTDTQPETQAAEMNASSQVDAEPRSTPGAPEDCGSKNVQKEGDSGTTDSTNGLAQLAVISQAAKRAPTRRKRTASSSRAVGDNPNASCSKDNVGSSDKSKSQSPSESARRNSSGERGIKNSRGLVEATSSEKIADDKGDDQPTK